MYGIHIKYFITVPTRFKNRYILRDNSILSFFYLSFSRSLGPRGEKNLHGPRPTLYTYMVLFILLDTKFE